MVLTNTMTQTQYKDLLITCLIIRILLLLSKMITKRLQVTKWRKPNLSLYMKTTMVLWSLLKLEWIPTTPLVPTLYKKRKGGSMDGLTNMTCGTTTPTHLQMRLNLVAPICSRETTVFLNWTRPNTTGNRKKESLVKYLHLSSRIFTLADVKNKHGTFEANY